MEAGKHPDFIEIDAASHTGVDNVRQIIDSASFLPLMGRKKIYLIDEAHMLSKAAFNAMLKILEEPPDAVVFILATTDQDKIIETVRSRCFQVCFGSVGTRELVKHLAVVCANESIAADEPALDIVARESQGSVRDALNMLERVRFAKGRITVDTVLAVLGHMSDDYVVALFSILADRNEQRLVELLRSIAFETFDADYVWKRSMEFVRFLVWSHHGLEVPVAHVHAIALKNLAQKYTHERLMTILETLYAHERAFARTSSKHLVLEMLLVSLCHDGCRVSGVEASQALECATPQATQHFPSHIPQAPSPTCRTSEDRLVSATDR